jgi:hypothetical protein
MVFNDFKIRIIALNLIRLNLKSMIQRIQTVYLFLIFLLSCFMIGGPVMKFVDGGGAEVVVKFTGISGTNVSGSTYLIFPLSVLALGIPILAIVAIFLYGKRNIQLGFAKGIILLIFLYIILGFVLSYFLFSDTGFSYHFVWRNVIPVVELFFSIFAYLGIRKDDELIKSYDRLR